MLKLRRNIRILFKLIAYVIAYVMKKLFLFISIFFLTSLSNSISAPIKVYGLDVTMDLKTSEDILKKQN